MIAKHHVNIREGHKNDGEERHNEKLYGKSETAGPEYCCMFMNRAVYVRIVLYKQQVSDGRA